VHGINVGEERGTNYHVKSTHVEVGLLTYWRRAVLFLFLGLFVGNQRRLMVWHDAGLDDIGHRNYYKEIQLGHAVALWTEPKRDEGFEL